MNNWAKTEDVPELKGILPLTPSPVSFLQPPIIPPMPTVYEQPWPVAAKRNPSGRT
jgi:hypothetical protein